MKNKSAQSAFTLIELLVVIAIIAVLATVVFVALNPAQRFADARDSRRTNDVQNILTAIHECIVDADGVVASCLPGVTAGATVYEIVNTGVVAACNAVCPATASGSCAAIDDELAPYLVSLPVDPGGATVDHTEYSVNLNANNIVTVTACSTEGATTISASR